MLTRSKQFDEAITVGAPVVVTAAVQRSGATVADIDLLPGATIALDDSVESRRTFSGQVADDGTLAPHLASDTLAPFSIELVVSTGLLLPAPSLYSQPYVYTPNGAAGPIVGNLESVQLGVFRVNVVEDDSTGLITISGPDRSFVVASALNESPYTITAGTPLDVAIGNYLATKYPSLPFLPDGEADTQIIATTVVYQTGTSSGDPWSNMQALAADFGRELFVDNLGRAILRPIPDPTAWPVSWAYQPGTANLAESGTHIMDTSQNVQNVVIVSSGGTGVAVPATASVEITDPTSPIYPDPNGFGRRPLFFTTPQQTNYFGCLEVATALLNQKIGAFDQVSFTAIPHPCHEPGDVVSYVSQLLGLQVQLVLGSWTLQVDLQAPSVYTTRTAGAQAEIVVSDIVNPP